MRERRKFLVFFGILFWVLNGVSVVLSALMKSGFEWAVGIPLIEPSIKWLHGAAPITVLGSTISVGLLGFILKNSTTRKVDRAIKALLDDFHRSVFKGDDNAIEHRVTLFKHKIFCWRELICIWEIFLKTLSSFVRLRWVGMFRGSSWKWFWSKLTRPWAGWLVPYERNGEYTLKTNIRFQASKDRHHQAEGMAGLVFKTRNCIYRTNLPDPSAPKNKKTIF